MKIRMQLKKVCKGSVRYDTDNPEAAVTNVYVSKTALPATPPASITVVVEMEATT